MQLNFIKRSTYFGQPFVSSSRYMRANIRNIKVILLQDLMKKGELGDIVEVRPGFVRNHLYPKGLAVYATIENKEKYKGLKEYVLKKKLKAEMEENEAKKQIQLENEKKFEILAKQKEDSLQNELSRAKPKNE
mmetsp:Transcript_15417/g.22909  ORF Transcript_15417/g.22909 Transcript_15417/m.22909 type:complete len:133 (+) Transcript_15417:93-491(+)